MALQKGIEASIAYASTRSISGRIYGSMLLGIADEPGAVETALAFLTDAPNVVAEEVEVHV